MGEIIIFNNEELIKRIRLGDLEAKEEILEANKPIIFSIIKRYFYVCLSDSDKEDLFQAANLGLIKATERYKSEFGTKFITYAYYLIKGEAQIVFESLKRRNKYISSTKDEKKELIREYKNDNLEFMVMKNSTCLSLNDFDKVNNKIYLKELLDEMPEEQKRILEYRYFNDLSQKEVGEILERSQVYVSRQEKKAKETLNLRIDRDDCIF